MEIFTYFKNLKIMKLVLPFSAQIQGIVVRVMPIAYHHIIKKKLWQKQFFLKYAQSEPNDSDLLICHDEVEYIFLLICSFVIINVLLCLNSTHQTDIN